MPSLAPVVANHSSSVRAAGLILARAAPGFAIPTFLRTNNKAGHTAHFVRWTRYARLCRRRYMPSI
jgi:hypothetical protein